jgi:hypothetical protein
MTNQGVLEQLRGASAIALKQPLVMLGFFAAVVGPFALLMLGVAEGANLPWYFLVGAVVFLLFVVATGFGLYTRNSELSKEISISPDRR